MKITIILLVVVFFFCIVVFSINLHVEGLSQGLIFEKVEALDTADAILILGASVYQDGRLTPVLEDRVLSAIEAYQGGKAPKLLVSGDNSTPAYNEVVPIRKFLIERGVPEEDIFVDFAGFNTYDSVYRAKEIFEIDSIIIVTQEFHLPRALFIARSMGMTAEGLSADKREYYIRNHIRESLATVHTFFKVKFGTEPKFLGEKIPITGSGLESFPKGEIEDETVEESI